MSITKEFIEENLLTVNKSLNNRKTKYLDETNEELYLIYHNTTPRKCECGKPTTFQSFTKGYLEFYSQKYARNSKKPMIK